MPVQLRRWNRFSSALSLPLWSFFFWTRLILTTDRLAGPKDLGYFWIHVDHHILLCLDFVVSLPHLGLDPLGEGISSDRVDYVGYVLPW